MSGNSSWVTQSKSISLFYPMYNELEAITPMTHKALEVMKSITDDFEILIVDDGSSDGSEKIADELALLDPRIKVIHHQTNQGYGQALITGFRSASKAIVLYTDCDEPHDLWEIPNAVKHMRDHEMVIGYRKDRWDGWRRFAYSKVYNTLVRTLFGVNVRDINCSFKMIWRTSLAKLHLSAGSAFIDGELLAEAAYHHLRIYQIPLAYQIRSVGYSKFNTLKPVIDTFKEIIAYRQRHRHHVSASVLSERT